MLIDLTWSDPEWASLLVHGEVLQVHDTSCPGNILKRSRNTYLRESILTIPQYISEIQYSLDMPASAILYAHQNDDAVSSILAIGQHPQQPIQSSLFDCQYFSNPQRGNIWGKRYEFSLVEVLVVLNSFRHLYLTKILILVFLVACFTSLEI